MANTNNLQSDCQQTGVIYKITCTLNGKIYVGQTRQGLNRRIIEHKRDTNRNRPSIDAAIRKYGWENFTAEVIEVCPVEKLDEREMFWIRELNSKAPNGYNLTDGGDGCKYFSPRAETRAKLSAALKSRPAHNKSVKLSPEARAKMSATQKAIIFRTMKIFYDEKICVRCLACASESEFGGVTYENGQLIFDERQPEDWQSLSAICPVAAIKILPCSSEGN